MASKRLIQLVFLGILGCFTFLGLSDGSGVPQGCPWACSCEGAVVDCSHRGLFQVPKHLPYDAERIDLQGNNVTIVFQSDFQNNKKLKILQLSDNQIHTIERDAFVELTNLERLKLNSNRLAQLPDGLFMKQRQLQRLDLSRNELTALGRRALRGLASVRSLHLDNNRLKCVDEKALEQLKNLDILTLNNNNLTYLMLEPASALRLRTLRLADNPMVCDCRLARLAGALRAAPAQRPPAARCQAPASLRGTLVTDVAPHEFVCTGPTAATPGECSAEPRCPVPCRCTPEGTIDCREKVLNRLPQGIPDHATEIRLEQNEIAEVGHKAFASQKRVARIDLSNNKITKLAADAFSGLKSLTSLVLYGNKIKDLPAGIFHGLTSLQLLLLNSNEISCVRKDTFRDLQGLKLLSMYDNNIHTLPNGTFDSLVGIQTLHLGRNPFACTCGLRWLSVYLRRNPIETSGAKCEAPKRLARKRIDALREDNFKCKPGEDGGSGTCGSPATCPASCLCESGAGGAGVECAGAALADVPHHLPLNTATLILPNNKLTRIKSDGLFGRLPDLTKLDLRNNELALIEDNAFDGAASIQELLLDGNRLTTVTDKMFLGLHGLNVLSLTENLISCITPGAFDQLTGLSTLNLESNQLSCSCHLAWLATWLRARGLSRNAACAAPQHLAGRPLLDVDQHDFQCSASDVGCLPTDYCPPSCTCAGTIVRCSRAKLQALPQNIPRQTTELYLESNEIASLSPEELRHLTQLTRLDISNNRLSVLANNTFEALSQLSTLIVSYNKLRCLQRDALKGLRKLRVLSLHGNNISTVPDGGFRDLESITHVALGSNPLYCDCSLRWLSEWVKRDYVEPGIARCAEPPPMKDKLLLSTQSSGFVCRGKMPDELLSKCDRCYTRPCRHAGRCAPTAAGGYSCACARGYHGDTCQHQIDACYGSPCVNGAACNLLEEGRFNCTCVPGYTGLRCEVNVDDCVDNKCENNATCVDSLNAYSCQCADGFMGEFCEKKIPFCTAEFNPCANGASCVDHRSHYACVCPRGYSGQNCTVNADDCANHMCQNGATCVDGLDEYACSCAAGHAGRYCEVTPHAALAGTSPCAHHDCVHGVCYLPQLLVQDDIMMAEQPLMGALGNNDYLCKCAPGYSGRLCEYLTSLSFSHNDSLVELEPLRTRPEANVTLVFSTTATHGVLLYYGQTEHLAVELFNERIRVSYDVGNHPVSTMYSFEMVSDGEYHKVELLAVKKNFTLKVDGGPARSIINEGTKEYLRLSRPLYLGGVPEEVGREAYARWHLRNLTSFKGCVREAWINHKQVDFVNAVRQVRVAAGCGDADDTAPPAPPPAHPARASAGMMEDARPHQDPCVPNPCKRGGRCVPEDGSTSDYTCRCRPGTRGAQCELLASIGGAPVITQAKQPPRRQPAAAITISASPAVPAALGGKQVMPHAADPANALPPCRKEAVREYLSEGSCRSRRPVRSARCSSARSACRARACCAPRKTKRRKVRLVCADGTRFTKDIEIVRKCACNRKCTDAPLLN